ncbi:4Fe-4S binding protein [Candidatus Bathyarchaeota archaeon]|nr:4Fe-4S binding protein [Candidatus Bathyarchaeota archaeon]
MSEVELALNIIRALIIVGAILLGVLAILIWVKDKTKRVSYLRLFIQIVSVPIVFLGLIIGPFGLPQYPQVGNAPRDVVIGTEIFGRSFPDGLSVPILACWYPSGRTVTCPVWQMQAYLYPFWEEGVGFGWGVLYTTPGWERLAIVIGLVVVMALVLGRFFCGWICPFGLYMDLLSRIRSVFKKPYRSLSNRTNAAIMQLRYVIIAIFMILSVILGAQAIFGVPLVSGTEKGGYLYSYLSAPYCQVCPMRTLSVLAEVSIGAMDAAFVFSHTTGLFYEAGYYITSINMVVLIFATIGSLMYRRLWCRICPVGALTGIFSRFTPFKKLALLRLTKDEEKCTKCGICKRVCPPQITEVYEEKGGDVTTSACILCLRCVEMCPYEDCLKLEVAHKPIFKSRNWLES